MNTEEKVLARLVEYEEARRVHREATGRLSTATAEAARVLHTNHPERPVLYNGRLYRAVQAMGDGGIAFWDLKVEKSDIVLVSGRGKGS